MTRNTLRRSLFGNETFTVIVDAGSSDTWLAGTGFKLLDGNITVLEADCAFGPTYNVTKNSEKFPAKN